MFAKCQSVRSVFLQAVSQLDKDIPLCRGVFKQIGNTLPQVLFQDIFLERLQLLTFADFVVLLCLVLFVVGVCCCC